jgi:hypothetical protein
MLLNTYIHTRLSQDANPAVFRDQFLYFPSVRDGNSTIQTTSNEHLVAMVCYIIDSARWCKDERIVLVSSNELVFNVG